MGRVVEVGHQGEGTAGTESREDRHGFRIDPHVTLPRRGRAGCSSADQTRQRLAPQLPEEPQHPSLVDGVLGAVVDRLGPAEEALAPSCQVLGFEDEARLGQGRRQGLEPVGPRRRHVTVDEECPVEVEEDAPELVRAFSRVHPDAPATSRPTNPHISPTRYCGGRYGSHGGPSRSSRPATYCREYDSATHPYE